MDQMAALELEAAAANGCPRAKRLLEQHSAEILKARQESARRNRRRYMAEVPYYQDAGQVPGKGRR